MLYWLILFVHVVASVILILVVLLQTGKRADLAGAFGGGGSQTAFGARGAATVLSKATTTFAVVFMATSLALSLLSSSGAGSGSVLETVETPATAPAETGEAPPPSAPADAPAGAGTDTEPEAQSGTE